MRQRSQYSDTDVDCNIAAFSDRRTPISNSSSYGFDKDYSDSDTDIAANCDRGSHVDADGGSGFNAHADSESDDDTGRNVSANRYTGGVIYSDGY